MTTATEPKNPARVLADILTAQGYDVDLDVIEQLAAYCDEPVAAAALPPPDQGTPAERP